MTGEYNMSNLLFASKSQKLKNGNIIFTPDEIVILSSMSKNFRKQNKKYSLLKQESIDEMLMQAFVSKDMTIRKDFEKVYSMFSKEVKDYYAKKMKKVSEIEIA